MAENWFEVQVRLTDKNTGEVSIVWEYHTGKDPAEASQKAVLSKSQVDFQKFDILAEKTESARPPIRRK